MCVRCWLLLSEQMSVSLLSYSGIEAENLADACPRGACGSRFGNRLGKLCDSDRSATSSADEQVLDASDDLSFGWIERLHVVGDLVAPLDGVSVGPTHCAHGMREWRPRLAKLAGLRSANGPTEDTTWWPCDAQGHPGSHEPTRCIWASPARPR